VTTAIALTEPAALTPADRCDRCGAQAYIRVVLGGGSELLFCAHHGRKYADRLRAVAIHIQDESGKLAATPAVAPDDER